MSNRPEDQNHLLPPSGLSSSPVRKVPKDYNFPRSVCDLVGRTPLLELARVGNGSRLLIKLECFNPTGSAKIRMALAMVRSAERRGQIKPGYTIVEPTSGNTGLGLALAAAQLGYKFIGVVDSHAAPSKLAAMKAYGAELIVVDGPSDRPSTMLRRKKAEEICSSSPYVWWPDQHNNPNNPLGYSHLAEELDSAISASIDVLVASVGTGGNPLRNGTPFARARPFINHDWSRTRRLDHIWSSSRVVQAKWSWSSRRVSGGLQCRYGSY